MMTEEPLDPGDYAAARHYLAPYPASSWRWDAGGQVVEWSDGTTIVFRQELEQILRRLAPRGLPPLNVLLLLLAACRETWNVTASRLIADFGAVACVERSHLPEWLPEVFRRLDAVHALPADLRHDLPAKTLLAEMVFEDSPNAIPPEEAARVIRGLVNAPDTALLVTQPANAHLRNPSLAGLRLLHDRLERVDAGALRLRRKTGLDALVQPADVDLGPADRVRRLIAELRHDVQLGGVARMAGQLLAAVHLPRPVAHREDLPVGGMSDIATRGPLDRLLISELAQDDLMLAARIAMNEALYLRREVPPRHPPRHRAILIDAGIRLWGVPRVFATAVAMAIAATADRQATVHVYRAAGQQVVPIDLTDRNGLIEHLGALVPESHPGDALTAFFDAASPDGSGVDLVVITGEDVAADADFRRAMSAPAASAVLLATVSRDGRFRLVAQGARQHRIISEVRLELERLLAARLPARPALIDPRRSTALPAILAVKPFPLLLSYQPVAPDRHWAIDSQGVLGISHERCLMHWQVGAPAARLLAENLPAGRVHWATGSWPICSAIVGRLQQRSLWLLNIDVASGACQVHPLELDAERPKHVCGHGGLAFVVYRDHVDVFETADGRKREPLAIDTGKVQWHGRFFADQYPACGRQWRAISFDGIAVRCEPVFKARNSAGARQYFLTFVEPESHDGPIGLRDDGYLYDPATDRIISRGHKIVGPFTPRALARNGRWLAVAPRREAHRVLLIEVPSGQSRLVGGDPALLVEPEIAWIRPMSLRKRFRGVCVDRADRLTLVSEKEDFLSITFNAATGRIELCPADEAVGDAQVRRFRPCQTPASRGYTLKVAAWEDGSRVFLDARGLLHLSSSDAAVPELTLLMNVESLAGWCADGRVWGPTCFTGSVDGADPGTIYSGPFRRFLERLR